MHNVSTIDREFVVSHLRYQLAALKGIVDDIENSNRMSNDYIDEELKKVAASLKQLRRLC
jgi:hypothetical protein